MRVVVSILLIILFGGSFVFADTDLEEQLRENRQRIERLEEQLRILQNDIEYLQVQLNTSQPGGVSVDPLVGKWNCSNTLYNYDMAFEADGHMVQEEVFLGNARANTWRRVGDAQIVFGNGLQLQPEFQSDDVFTLQVVKSGTLWECQRISE